MNETRPSTDSAMAGSRPRYEPIESPPWPGGAEAAISLTFDLDGEAGMPVGSFSISAISERTYGVGRGLERILTLLSEHDVRASFYVPGIIAERHPDTVRRVTAEGHDVGHHGYRHFSPGRVDESLQREEIERGLASIETVTGETPRGYRAPYWELSQATYDLLCENGFLYDSSCMEDDRPHRYLHPVGDLLEFPVHWSLDDWPYYSWSGSGAGNLFAPSTPEETWTRELRSIVADGRHTTFTMHPEVTGRGNRITALEGLLREAANVGPLAFLTHAELADLLLS